MNPKVIAAVAGAIRMFLEAERQLAPAAAVEETRVPEAPRPMVSLWAVAGRQSMMDMRRFYQMRLVR